MTNRKWLIGAGALLILAGAAYLGSPYWAAHRFVSAARSGDVDAIDAAVDFPAVRESLKAQMTAMLTKRLASDPEMASNPFSGLGMLLMPTLINRAVDAYVTPEAISLMAKSGKAKPADAGQQPTIEPPKVSYQYGLSRFRMKLLPKTGAGEGATFVFERRGFISWKVIKLELPQNLAGNL